MTDDPMQGSPYRFGDSLDNGRMLHESITSTEHDRDALKIIETLDHDDLKHLALYIAADAAATRGQEQASGQVWLDWWRGIDSLDPDAPPDADDATPGATPGMLWRIVRPGEGDDPDRAPNT